MGLFSTSLEERRQRFVQNRQFPRLEIKFGPPGPGLYDQLSLEWIEQQRQAESPDFVNWPGYVLQLDRFRSKFSSMDIMVDLLSCTSSNVPARDEPTTSLLEAVVSAMQAGSCQVFKQYQGGNFLAVLTVDGQQTLVLIKKLDQGNKRVSVNMDQVTPRSVMEILLQQWHEQVQDWTRIRERLIELLEESLQEVEQDAGQAFDQAVGVTDDGLEIMTAHQVAVIEKDGSVTSYAPEVFVGNKIRFEPPLCRATRSGFLPLKEQAILKRIMPSLGLKLKPGQQVRLKLNPPVLAAPTPKRTVLITPRALVPELPAGTPTIG